jgi:hypothetical protein
MKVKGNWSNLRSNEQHPFSTVEFVLDCGEAASEVDRESQDFIRKPAR